MKYLKSVFLVIVIMSISTSAFAQVRGQICYQYEENRHPLTLQPIDEATGNRSEHAALHLDRALRELEIMLAPTPGANLFDYVYARRNHLPGRDKYFLYLGHAVQCGSDDADLLWASWLSLKQEINQIVESEWVERGRAHAAATEAEKARLAALPPTPLDQQTLQGALDRYLYTYMRSFSISKFGVDLASFRNGRLHMATMSMRYQITQFNGCRTTGNNATCSAVISVNAKDEFNYGASTFHTEMSKLQTALFNTNRQLLDLNLKFKDGEWLVLIDLARLLGLP